MVPKIFQGDDTDANGRTVAIQLPDEDMAGFRMRFEFLGRTFEFDELPRGGSVRVDFDADDTAMFPLGTHYGTIRLQKNGRWHTVSNTVPVTVSDEVGAVYCGDASAIHLEMQFCGGIPDLTGVNDSPANANELARAFKALLDALKSAPRSLGMLALAFCMSAFGASARLSVQSAPLGEVAFSSRVVTGVDFDESGLVTSDEITDVVREGQLKSMSWTNDNFKTAVEAVSPRVELPTDIVNSVNGQTGSVVLTGSNIATSAEDNKTVADSISAKEDKLTAPQKAVLAGGPYLPLSGGTMEDGATINLNSLGASIGGGPTDGTVYIQARGAGESDTPASGVIVLRASSVLKNGKEVATEEQVDSKADEFTEWVTSDPAFGVVFYNGHWWFSSRGTPYGAALSNDPNETRLAYDDITATRKRVLRTGDPSLNAEFDAWRTNDMRVVLGNSSEVTAQKGIAIGLPNNAGSKTAAGGNSSIAIGVSARTGANTSQSIAFGANATVTAQSAIQIGAGTNPNAGTLQVGQYRLLNADGTIPAERLGAAVTAETVTNVVERVRDLIYDEKRNITWRRVMYDGNLYYVAVTNANIVAEED